MKLILATAIKPQYSQSLHDAKQQQYKINTHYNCAHGFALSAAGPNAFYGK